MSARFEVVRSDAEQPWHARFRAANGRIVWTMEQYARKASAFKAIDALLNEVAPYARRVLEVVDLEREDRP